MASVTSNFEERDLGSIVDELFRVYLRNFLPFLGIIAVAGIPVAIIGATLGWYALSYPLLDTAELTTLFLLIVVLVVASVLAYVLISAAVTYAVAEYYQGNRIAISQAYRFAWHRLGSLVGAVFLAGLAIFAMSITIIGIPVAIYFGVTWVFIVQTVVLERRSARRSLSRSSILVKNMWWRVIGILIIIGLIESILSSVAVGIVGFTIGLVGGLADIPLVELTSNFAGSLVGMIFLPIGLIGTTLLYFDLRIRKEGYNLEVMTQELGMTDKLGWEREN